MRVQEASRGYSRKLGCTGVEVNVLACSIAAGDTDSLLGLKLLGLIQIAAGVVCIATKTPYLIILAGSMEKRRLCLWVDVAIDDIPTPAAWTG